ncbi:TonB-dependent receptor [Novosphingobium capsulatum]|uniref:TonB-dependent receptor n=1 Tax=Novosphingobium capsulatum TaxID=13688 RepID=UPI000A00FE47|nr:TonB-dependent receptor [Novosphingobium capsulatum]WQD94342.1 TonB-dependent receptor [Novosphingobium capsulatum]
MQGRGEHNEDARRCRLAVNRKLLITAAWLPLGLAIAPTAHAADDGPADVAASGEEADGTIVVTATKRAASLEDVPVAVSVASGEAIARAQIRDLKDLTSLVPSLSMQQLQSPANVNIYIRGFGNGANNSGIEPSVGVFVDGVYRSRTAAQIADLPDVEQVEVLRGPQSTLFGKNASAGVISIITRLPQFTPGADFEASYGNYNAQVFKGLVTGPLTDTLAVSVAAGRNRRDGFIVDPDSGQRSNGRNRWFVRGQALWQPGDDLSLRVIGDYGLIDEVCCAPVNVQSSAATQAVLAIGGKVNAPDAIYADQAWWNFDSTNRIANYGFSGQLDYKASRFKLTAISAWRRLTSATNQDSDFTSGQMLARNAQDLTLSTFTEELRLATDLPGPFNALAGVYYFNETLDQRNAIAFGQDMRAYANLLVQGASAGALSVPLLEQVLGGLEGDPARYAGRFFAGGQGSNERYRLRNQAFSAFFQGDLKLGGALTLTAGAAFTSDTKRYTIAGTTTDAFAGVDLDGRAYAPFRQQLLAAAGFRARGVNFQNPAAIAAFAHADPQGYAAILRGAATDANNPAANPLGALRALQLFPPYVNVPNAVEPGRTHDQRVTWTARATVKLNAHMHGYASVATGFKASSINLSRDSRPFPADQAALEGAGLAQVNQTYATRFAGPERTTVYELGLKAQWGLATANIAVFQQTISGFQSNVFTGTGFALVNAGKERVRGVEVETVLRPAAGLTLSGSATWLDPLYQDFTMSAVGDLSGRRPASIPALSFTLAGQYEHSLGRNARLFVRSDFHHESPVITEEGLPGFLDLGTAAAIAASAQYKRRIDEVNAALGLTPGARTEFTLWARNLTNNRTLTKVFDSVAQPLAISGYTNQPRTYGASVRYRF